MLDTAHYSEDNTTSSEEDEAAELVTEDVEYGFLNVFNQLKNKDPQIYKEGVNYFSNESGQHSSKNKTGKVKPNDSVKKSGLDGLGNFWTSQNLNNDEKFLRDYILNKKFLGNEDINMEEELKKLKEEEKELEEEAMFEYKYNNRYEEQPDEEFVKKYPHTLGIVTKNKSASSSETNLTRKKEELTFCKRKHDTILEAQSKRARKNTKISKLVPNIDQAQTQKNKFETLNRPKFVINQIDPQVLKNGNIKKTVVKNEMTRRITKNKNREKLAEIGNVKLKKKLRYKSRRKKSVKLTEAKSEDKEMKKVVLNRKAGNIEKIVEKPESGKNKVNIQKKMRKRSRTKLSSGVIRDVAKT